MNNPIPSNMKSEAKKAAKILREFTEISNRTGPDKLIPANILAKCQGLAIITVIKAGFMITARGGSGIVIARLADGRWSAPSAIGIAGLGGGFEIGVEVSDLVVILMQRRAVDSFSKGGNLTLGGNCTVAVGPMGRNVEADVALRSTAAVFTYCKSRGLFAGVSLEGSCLIERKDTNRKFYSQDIRASAILNGDVEPPPEADDLYCVLESYTDKYTTEWTAKHLAQKASGPPARPRAPATQRPASTYRTEVKPSLYPSVSAFKSGSTDHFRRPSPLPHLAHQLIPDRWLRPFCLQESESCTPSEKTYTRSLRCQQLQTSIPSFFSLQNSRTCRPWPALPLSLSE
ncbi:SH3 domain-containing YSC84-like protein 1 isoform X4 [Oncorhynchus nerka]|uniref:SH3 domain-containing YSC84-like protein 1 isoform X4 n=1 Tax=Oncorhynchus nerka TaxID=8023 RepID=UPI0031B897C0